MRHEYVQLTVEPIGPFRTEELMGVEHRVFPAVLVREKVLNNNIGRCLLPGAEIEASVDSWNGIPAVIRHPTSRGVPVSARSPEILNARGVGSVFNAGWDEERRALVGDVWVNLARVEEVPDARTVVNQVEKGGAPGEVSTGFGTNVEETGGTWEGESFDFVLRGIEPDHLALLVEETGACSVGDGCGLGVNCNCEPEEAPAVDPPVENQDPPVAENQDDPPAPTEAEPPEAGDGPPGPGRMAQFREWLAGLFSVRNESDQDRLRLLRDALQESFGGPDVFVWVEASFADDGLVVFGQESRSGNQDGLYRTTFEIAESGAVTLGDREEVRRVTEFVPVANAAGDHHNPPEEGESMNRDDVIAQLAERSPLSAESLAHLSDEELTALQENFPESTDAPPTDDAPAENAGDDADDAEVPAAVNRLIREVAELRKARDEDRATIATLQEAAAPAVQEREQERANLIRGLAANDRCAFEQEELEAKGLDELRKLDRMARPTSYLGRGGPKAPARQAEGDEPAFAPVVPYHAQNGDAEGGNS